MKSKWLTQLGKETPQGHSSEKLKNTPFETLSNTLNTQTTKINNLQCVFRNQNPKFKIN